jgi:arabinogalactan endo-1,4-beta-galactosidase
MAYNKGAWENNGRPTEAMDAFRDNPPSSGLVYNPGFEYTASTQLPLGWSTSTSTGDADADFTENYGQASLFQLTHRKATAYQVRTFQQLTNVPNGTYTLRAWAQSSGGQNVCQLYAAAAGAPELAAAVPGTAGVWVRVEVPGVRVANGQCEIGLRSDANAGNECSIDDVEFVLSQATAAAPAAATNAPTATVAPNPYRDGFSLNLTLPASKTVQVSLYNSTGQLLRTLLPAQQLAAGAHAVRVETDAATAPGVYLLKITTGNQILMKKIVKL